MKALRPRWGLAPLLAALLLSAPTAFAQEDGFLTLTADSLTDARGPVSHFEYGRGHFGPSVGLLGTWRYRAGDDPAWADPRYDDSDWTSAHTWFDYHAIERGALPPGLPGIGWFRLHLRVDSALAHMPLGLAVYRGSATEVYLDGELVHKTGRVGRTRAEEEARWDYTPTAISLREDATHVLAVRYSNFSAEEIFEVGEDAGFYLMLGVLPTMLESHARLTRRASVHQMLLTGILLALAFLHLMLFLLFQKAKAHLYFAVFVACFAGVVFGDLQIHFITSNEANVLRARLTQTASLLSFVAGLLFAHEITHGRMPRYVYVLTAVITALGISLWFTHLTSQVLMFDIILIVDMVRVYVKGIIRKREDAWIIGLGLLPLVVLTILMALTHLQVVAPFWDHYEVPAYGYAMLALVLSMSVYLARDFARTKRGLALANTRLEDYSRTLEQKVEARTAELRAEKEKTEAQARRLRELDRAKSRFFANVSHEFRTPLTLILGPTESALQGTYGPLPTPLRRQLERTRHHARRLLRLVGQLLDLARIESGKLTLHAQRADLAAFLRRVVRAFTPLAERERLALSFRSDVRALPWVFDAEKLEQVVANLLSNALKFTPEGGKVWVTLTTSPGNGEAAPEEMSAVEIVVKDTGPGIAEADLERVFDRFEQVDGSATRAHEGTGIGLSLARELVELHGGRLLVRSEEGFGSAFIVRLPLAPDEGDLAPERAAAGDGVAERAADAVKLEAASASVGETSEAPADVSPADAPVILIVEDNADVRAFLREELEAHHQIVEAADGEAGLEAAQRHAPDLVLSDVMMPKLDGYTLCRKLKEDERLRHVPVVLLTAKAAEEDTLQGLACGADDYLAKPFSAEALKARVANLLASRRQLRAQFSREVVVQPSGVVVASDEEAFLERVLHVIEDQMQESEFGVEALAEAVGVSARQLRRRVKAVTGESPGALVRRMRLERAAQFLEAGAGTVAEVGYRVGFESASHFSKAFRAHFGHAPTDHAAERTQGSENRTGPP